MAILALWLLVWSLLWSFSCQNDKIFSFVNPPPSNSEVSNLQYTVGSDINIEWVGPREPLGISVYLIHVRPGPNTYNESLTVFSLPCNVTNLGGHYTWPIALGGMNLTISNLFFFSVYIEGERSPRATSHYFNLTLSKTTTMTATSTSATLSSTSAVSTSPASNITSVPTVTSTGANSVPPPSNGLSAGARAGIGLGVSVGALALIAASVFFWRRRRGLAVAGGRLEVGQLPGTSYEAVDQQSPDKPADAAMDHVASELSGSGPPPVEMADTSKA